MTEKQPKVTFSQKSIIILAGGEGERMRETITSWLGHPRPKQYCTFVGTRSMLQHTVDRARALVADDCITTVIGPNHRRFLQTDGNPQIAGRILEQPSQKDTAPGLFFALTHVMVENPDTTVIIFPSDHYVFPDGPFLEKVDRAVTLTECRENSLILLAAVPDGCETDYGWIRTSLNPPSFRGFSNVREIDAFIEKPCSEMAESCFLSGCYWNTMVMVAKARTLWQLGCETLPSLMSRFETLRRVVLAVRDRGSDSQMVEIATRHLYRNLAPANFSRCILEKVTKQLLILPLSDIEWSDWGRPSRIVECLAHKGKVPLFLSESSRQSRDRTGGSGEAFSSQPIKPEKASAEGAFTALHFHA